MNLKRDSKSFFKDLGKYSLILPLFLGLLFRLYKMTESAIWHDEGYTIWLLQYDIGEIIARTARDVHPPAYYLIAKPYVEVFGNSVFSIRFLSLLFSLGIIYLAYKIVIELFGKKPAFWVAMLLAFSPFMVRFGQEARMYGVVGFFTTLSTYLLIKYLKDKKRRFLILYVFATLLAIYTQYYAFFVIMVQWLVVMIYTPGLLRFNWRESIKRKSAFFDPYWWLANVAILIAYLPWFPVAYKQVTRVSDNYWIKPEWITIKTIPNNILQFVFYNHLEGLHKNYFGEIAFWFVIILAVFSGLILIKKIGPKKLSALYLYAYLPMILVFVLSKVKTPIYQDRYFLFSAVGVFAIWGLTIGLIEKRKLRLIIGIIFLSILTYGNCILHLTVDHGMARLHKEVGANSLCGDIYLSGELYTYLDGAYYFGYDTIKLLSEGVDGYGETSLFYDQQEKYLIKLREAKESGERIWVIGKIGEKEYYKSAIWSEYEAEIIYSEDKNNGLKAVLYTPKEEL